MQGWCKIKKAAEFSGISERTLRDWLKDGLKCSRLPSGTVLIKYEWLDAYLEAFAAKEDQVDRIVAETMRGMR
jgi:predicted site-specific integrase-resolvase